MNTDNLLKELLENIAGPNNQFINAIANALKPHLITTLNNELEMHKGHFRKLTHKRHEEEPINNELESRVDNVEQYMRRDCLVISGIQEPTNQTTFENTDQAVIDLAKSKLHVDLTPSDISRSHRVHERHEKENGSVSTQGRHTPTFKHSKIYAAYPWFSLCYAYGCNIQRYEIY